MTVRYIFKIVYIDITSDFQYIILYRDVSEVNVYTFSKTVRLVV